MEAEAFWLMEDFSQTTSGKSIPTILNRKRKLTTKTLMVIITFLHVSDTGVSYLIKTVLYTC